MPIAYRGWGMVLGWGGPKVSNLSAGDMLPGISMLSC